MKIILIGFMGSGKTSVAKELGRYFNLPIIEMDELVYQKTATKNMYEVFMKGGEALLRETEIAIAREHVSHQNCIVSTGGGVVLNEMILENLKKDGGIVVFLNASFKTIAKRLTDDAIRPLFRDLLEAESLHQFRYPLYDRNADVTIDVDGKSIEQIAQEAAEMSLRS